MNQLRGVRVNRTIGSILALLLFAGCQQQAPPAFSLSEATLELPELHQQQISDQLRRQFGSPLQPTIRNVTLVDDQVEFEDLADRDQVKQLEHGAILYAQRCAGCHGAGGDGAGEAAEYLLPRPRDYRAGIFKFTSTPYGAKPHKNDIVRVLLAGAKGTSMPSFKWMPHEEIDALTAYVIYLSQRGNVEKSVGEIAEIDYEEDEEIDQEEFNIALEDVRRSWDRAQSQVTQALSPRPAYDDDSIAKGRAAFLSRGCSKCHGEDGKGQTDWLNPEFVAQQEALAEDERVQINYDAWGNIAPAADLTARMLHGGRRPIDIYRRIATGINGTPMPAFADALAEEPDTIWHLTHYVLSIVEGKSASSSESDPATP